MARDYQKEYREYHSKPSQIRNRSNRNKARRLMAKERGKEAIKGKDIDHKHPISKGGSNSEKNLRVRSVHSNRGDKTMMHSLASKLDGLIEFKINPIAAWGLGGAAIGGTIGAIGSEDGERVTGALNGAIGGGFAGAAMRYHKDRYEQSQKQWQEHWNRANDRYRRTQGYWYNGGGFSGGGSGGFSGGESEYVRTSRRIRQEHAQAKRAKATAVRHPKMDLWEAAERKHTESIHEPEREAAKRGANLLRKRYGLDVRELAARLDQLIQFNSITYHDTVGDMHRRNARVHREKSDSALSAMGYATAGATAATMHPAARQYGENLVGKIGQAITGSKTAGVRAAGTRIINDRSKIFKGAVWAPAAALGVGYAAHKIAAWRSDRKANKSYTEANNMRRVRNAMMAGKVIR